VLIGYVSGKRLRTCGVCKAENNRKYNREYMACKRANRTPEERRADLVRLKQWKIDNPEKIAAQKRRNYHRWSPEKKTEHSRRYRKNNVVWKAKNPGSSNGDRRGQKQRRKAREKSLPATLTAEQWKETLEFFGYLCAYCGEEWEHQDHFVPLSKGGGYTQDNIVPSCVECNLSKSSLLPQDWCSTQQYSFVGNYLWILY